jgi:hypothetical protein
MASKKKALEADIASAEAAAPLPPAALEPPVAAPATEPATAPAPEPVPRPAKAAKAPATPAAPKEDWLDKYHGAVMKVPIELGSPMLNSLFNRTFYFTSRNIFYIQVFGPMILNDAELARTEELIRKLIQDAHTDINKELRAAEEVVASAGLMHLASYNSPRRVDAFITSPLSRLHLNLFVNADKLVLALNTLWLNNEIEGKEKGNAEYRIKKLLRGIAIKVRTIYFEVRRKQAQNNKGKANGEAQPDLDDLDMEDAEDALLMAADFTTDEAPKPAL